MRKMLQKSRIPTLLKVANVVTVVHVGATFGKSGSNFGNCKGGFYAEFAMSRQGFKPPPE